MPPPTSLQDLLPIIDDFERALQTEAPGAESYRQGLEIIHRALMDMLRKRGVTPIEAVGTDVRSAGAPGGGVRGRAGSPRRRSHGRIHARLSAGRQAAAPRHGESSESVSKRDYYEVLGVPKTAGDQQIKSAYRKLALEHHPDRNQGNKEAEERFKEAAEAYAILSDGDKRARYDRFGHAGVSSQAGAGFDPSTFAGLRGHLRRHLRRLLRRRPPRRSRARQRSALRPRDHVRGIRQGRRDRRSRSRASRHARRASGSGAAPGSSPTTCPQCQGRGQQRFQQGFFTVARTCSRCHGIGPRHHEAVRQRARAKGARRRSGRSRSRFPRASPTASGCASAAKAKAARHGGPPGDLYVFIEVAPHPFFRREGNNLACEIPLNFTTLALGGSIEVPTLDGHESFKVPEGTQSGTVFRLRGKGMPDVSGRGRGDLFFTVQAVTPKKLSKEQRAAARAAEQGAAARKNSSRARDDAEEDEKNIFEKVKDIFG